MSSADTGKHLIFPKLRSNDGKKCHREKKETMASAGVSEKQKSGT